MTIQCLTKEAQYSKSITSMDKDCKEMSLLLHLFQDIFNGFCSKFRNHCVRNRNERGNHAVRKPWFFVAGLTVLIWLASRIHSGSISYIQLIDSR